jgi:hypothetical protein
MSEKEMIDKYDALLVLGLVIFTLISPNIFGEYNTIVNLGLGAFCWFAFYTNNRKKFIHEIIIIRMLILSIPLSFRDIFGNPYGASIISWFNIFLLIILITYLIKYHFTVKHIFSNFLSLLSLLLIIIGLIPILGVRDYYDAIKQYINIVVPFGLIIIGNSLKDNINDNNIEVYKLDYILSAFISAIGVIIQIFFVQILNVTIGNYRFLGGYRHAYGFLFSDYSFLSLYLTSGAIMLYSLRNKYSFTKKMWPVYFVLLLFTSIFTSARTGIAAFIVVFIFYNIPRAYMLLKEGSKKKAIIIILEIILIVVISYLLINEIRGIAKFSDSGRMELNKRAWEIFMENPILGIGFGGANYIGTLPHNILFQYLAQGGLVFTIPLIVFLLFTLWLSYKNDCDLFYTLVCILLGSLFIPNIFDSRFLPVIYLLLSLKVNQDEINKLKI